MSDFSLNFWRPVDAANEIRQRTVYMIMGKLLLTSAASGAKMEEPLATKLQMPYAVELKRTGNRSVVPL